MQLGVSMSSSFLRVIGSTAVVLVLPACATQVPPDYSPHYVQVPVVSPTRPDRVVGYELVPEACLVPDTTDPVLSSRLPPGCANNANILAMTAKKRHVVRAPPLGPASGGDLANAAQRYHDSFKPQSTSGGGGGSGPGGTAGTAASEFEPMGKR
jgi:hypothetical protein